MFLCPSVTCSLQKFKKSAFFSIAYALEKFSMIRVNYFPFVPFLDLGLGWRMNEVAPETILAMAFF